MEQEAIRNALQSRQSFIVFGHYRASGQVGAGHDQRVRATGAAVQEQDMQGRVGEHDPQAAVGA